MSKYQFPDGVSTVRIGDKPLDTCHFKLCEIHKNVTVEILRYFGG